MKARAVLEAALYVDDLAACEAFYRDVLGLELVARVEGRHVFLRCGQNMVLLFDAEATKVPPSPDAKLPVPPHGARGQGHMCFAASAEELDSWMRYLEANGIAIEAAFEWPQGGRSIYIRDPSGNSIEFAEPKIWGF
ncbi:VOC family protein [Limoniibacter endophyticus]|uniref:Bleomycin resistance protein n=1 Tax=Limoniibacter endophyticus TaxID=1565040 RepID=A0A8J3GHQ6_9HYPH|nr:VOC family protein [Limoniibacter endophyticus]GHC80669.1 bleomycin resistance protein [Limoniibacter endophyticus]